MALADIQHLLPARNSYEEVVGWQQLKAMVPEGWHLNARLVRKGHGTEVGLLAQRVKGPRSWQTLATAMTAHLLRKEIARLLEEDHVFFPHEDFQIK